MEDLFEIAPCLKDGPIASSARSLVLAAQELGISPAASALRSWCVPYLFEHMERAFASQNEPVALMNRAFDDLASLLTLATKSEIAMLGQQSQPLEPSAQSVEEVTGSHYGRLFQGFAPTSFWDEPKQLLHDRLERNNILLNNLSQQTVLDAGCGGGRYSVAWRLLGAKHVTGLDISDINIQDARRRVNEAKIDNVVFQQGNVLNLPFEDSSFDIVFSNGVLHHTVDWRRGITELVRVLKPGGLGWLYLIENPGGMFWDTIEILRVLMKDEQRETALRSLQMLGYPGNRVFYMLDHVMAPINTRLTTSEIENSLRTSGATLICRLRRGADFDRVERIAKGDPFAELKYGIGENRYSFSKA